MGLWLAGSHQLTCKSSTETVACGSLLNLVFYVRFEAWSLSDPCPSPTSPLQCFGMEVTGVQRAVEGSVALGSARQTPRGCLPAPLPLADTDTVLSCEAGCTCGQTLLPPWSNTAIFCQTCMAVLALLSLLKVPCSSDDYTAACVVICIVGTACVDFSSYLQCLQATKYHCAEKHRNRTVRCNLTLVEKIVIING